MKLSVDKITETPSSETFRADSAWWEATGSGTASEDEVQACELEFPLESHLMGEDLLLEGEVRGTFEVTCSRCLERYRHPIRERFRLVLEPAGGRTPADPEGAAGLAEHGLYLSDELEAGWYQGQEIELDAFFREAVALALPAKPLCREDCQGLCPTCGVDRNHDSCDCAEPVGTSPFEVLRALRDGPRGRNEE